MRQMIEPLERRRIGKDDLAELCPIQRSVDVDNLVAEHLCQLLDEGRA